MPCTRRSAAIDCLRALPFLLSLLILPPAVAVQNAATAEDDADAVRGRLLFRIHCASCHGKAGRGDGPVAETLKRAPPDLTEIAIRNDGPFPAEEVQRKIDGRRLVRAHGSGEMPVWGASFQEMGRDSDQQGEVEAKLEALVAHLRSIQRGVDEEERD